MSVLPKTIVHKRLKKFERPVENDRPKVLVMAYGPVYPRANRPATARAGPGQNKARRADPVRAGPYGLGPGGLRANRSARRA